MLIDLHAKSPASPGVAISATAILEQARQAGLNGVAFCDTLATAHCTAILDAARAFEDLAVFIGVEIPTDKGIMLGFAPRVDAFYKSELWRRLVVDTAPPAAEDLIALFEAEGGAVVASRPYDLDIPFHMGDWIYTLSGLSGVEVFSPSVGELQQNFALEAASFMGVATTGGSDPKGASAELGRYATLFARPVRTQAEFVEALRQGECWAVQIGSGTTVKSTRQASEHARREGGPSSRPPRQGGGSSGGGASRGPDRSRRR